MTYEKCAWADCHKRATHRGPDGPIWTTTPRSLCTQHAFEVARGILEKEEFRNLVWALELFYRLGEEGRA
ncbi:MAG: hypothetical protein KatS3mg015_2518 [Fimbriimonadales bacterium]|nr:MAG: hypothetical protein KatS3mg015_2518 [Fimbriimonadales bacterium]